MAHPFPYTPFYCEENIYNVLCETLNAACPFDDAFAVVISAYSCPPDKEVANHWDSIVPYRRCAVPSVKKDTMIWDYHVIAVVGTKGTSSYYVVDFDSRLPRAAGVSAARWSGVCIDFAAYIQKTFLSIKGARLAVGGQHISKVVDNVRFRVVPCRDYLCFFRSDRTHMMDASGKFNSPPPSQPIIQDFHSETTDDAKQRYVEATRGLAGPLQRNNLVSFINTANNIFPGDVLSLDAFLSRFTDAL